MIDFLSILLAATAFAAPQPQMSRGLLVVYGGQPLIEANARYHSYDLSRVPGRCGLASISPAHLGQLAWVSMDQRAWFGPCLVVDVQGRDDALDSIFRRREVAEVERQMAGVLGFSHGAKGFVWFGACPPTHYVEAQPYAPAYQSYRWPWAPEPYRVYPAQERSVSCVTEKGD